jgi:RNA polymerase sigma factor (sigma-70 family)
VLRVCRALVGPVEADDAWSDTFAAALRAYPELPSGANVEAWLVRIATNKAIDHARARARRAVPAGTLLDTGADASSAAEEPMPVPAEDLRRAVAALPEKQRLAVSLHYLAGLPYRQVAAQLGGTPEAARRAAADGIARLRRQLARIGEAE